MIAHGEKIVLTGLSHYKLREVPSNRGAKLEKLLREDFCKEKLVPDTWKPGMAWCVRFALVLAFAPYTAKDCPKTLRKCASAIGATELRQRWEAAGGKCIRGGVAIGAIALVYDSTGDEYHAVICCGESADFPGKMVCLEGNGNDVGSAEGYEVCVRLRDIEDCAVLIY